MHGKQRWKVIVRFAGETWYWLHALFSLRVQIWPSRLEQLHISNAQPYSQKTASETFFTSPPWRVWTKQIKTWNGTNRRGRQSGFRTCPAGQNFPQWRRTCERTKQRVAQWCEGPWFPGGGGREASGRGWRLGEVHSHMVFNGGFSGDSSPVAWDCYLGTEQREEMVWNKVASGNDTWKKMPKKGEKCLNVRGWMGK